MPPFSGLMATPAFPARDWRRSGCRPIANITCSEAMLEPLDNACEFVPCFSTLSMVQPVMMVMPLLLHLGADMACGRPRQSRARCCRRDRSR
jgi:hypothetical protein